MDAVRDRINESHRQSRKKLWIGLVAVIMLIVCVILVEKFISSSIDDITIKKSEIVENKATFIELDDLDTNIIAVITSDGEYKLVFDDCEGCYQVYGKHYGYKDDGTGIVCKQCGHGVAYDEIGFFDGECSPVFIDANDPEIEETNDSFVLSASYLEKKKAELEDKRAGKVMLKNK